MGDYTLTTLGASTELLDLPFDVPLADWDDPRIVQVPRGISRHVVRFVRAQNQIFAIKEATDRLRAARAQPAARARRRGRSRWSTPSAPSSIGPRTTATELRGSADHPAPAVLAALPLAVHRARPARAAGPAARRAGRAVRPAAPGRLLLGRLLAVEHPVPPRRRRAGGLPGRRRDRRAAPDGSPTVSAATTSRSRPRTSPASCSTCRPPATRPSDIDPVETAMAPATPATRQLWDELTSDEVIGRGRELPHRPAAIRGSTDSASTSPRWTITHRATAAAAALRHPGRRARATTSGGCSR